MWNPRGHVGGSLPGGLDGGGIYLFHTIPATTGTSLCGDTGFCR